MKKALMLTAMMLALPSFAMAESLQEAKDEVKADHGAIAKDNAAIGKQEENLEVNRAEKAKAKAEGNYARQASESVQIGANKAVMSGKKAEKHVDQKILEKDKKDVQEKRNGAE